MYTSCAIFVYETELYLVIHKNNILFSVLPLCFVCSHFRFLPFWITVKNLFLSDAILNIVCKWKLWLSRKKVLNFFFRVKIPSKIFFRTDRSASKLSFIMSMMINKMYITFLLFSNSYLHTWVSMAVMYRYSERNNEQMWL